eukprot:5747076-Lingulodinium_polyedra.AAC.1
MTRRRASGVLRHPTCHRGWKRESMTMPQHIGWTRCSRGRGARCAGCKTAGWAVVVEGEIECVHRVRGPRDCTGR